ncbi:hypothetical protein PR048_027978 [Dryococelus australis]|uniref:Uncharacterized protein n=1 Tax=Dryococelus australis TaxID=614101 RepID=A0ABQ9GI10_9NEOP|nr:hypothetical protein PR048_027978 [Dryococelus australis]
MACTFPRRNAYGLLSAGNTKATGQQRPTTPKDMKVTTRLRELKNRRRCWGIPFTLSSARVIVYTVTHNRTISNLPPLKHVQRLPLGSCGSPQTAFRTSRRSRDSLVRPRLTSFRRSAQIVLAAPDRVKFGNISSFYMSVVERFGPAGKDGCAWQGSSTPTRAFLLSSMLLALPEGGKSVQNFIFPLRPGIAWQSCRLARAAANTPHTVEWDMPIRRYGACTSGRHVVDVQTYHFLKPNSAHRPRTASITHVSLQHGKHKRRNILKVEHVNRVSEKVGSNSEWTIYGIACLASLHSAPSRRPVSHRDSSPAPLFDDLERASSLATEMPDGYVAKSHLCFQAADLHVVVGWTATLRSPVSTLRVHAALREHCTSVQNPARSGDGALITRTNVALIAPALLGLKRGEKLQADVQTPSYRTFSVN